MDEGHSIPQGPSQGNEGSHAAVEDEAEKLAAAKRRKKTWRFIEKGLILVVGPFISGVAYGMGMHGAKMILEHFFPGRSRSHAPAKLDSDPPASS
eukprot:CAMPEP_0196657670 /NCGR_PEP_ID=MMETSP1086-20130531/24802_1 /TAXON_ID=77921 /ORGANISM="Cyanoptyche  gloeocystis , Strain SAG4.97" /LENGTH=94 /DNA_ID=CAMNT_0041990881 /DNA_START=95 /DNA_END=376 /DNA_ORIENTATION=+